MPLEVAGIYWHFAISVGFRLFHLGVLESVLLLEIAGIETLLVLLFFLRVRASSKRIWLFASGGFLWLGILPVFVISDYISRFVDGLAVNR